MVKRVCAAEKKAGLHADEETSLSNIKPGLLQVTYEWARGLEFKEITNLFIGNLVESTQALR
jgi:superfamily II RNA helicase